MRFLLQNRGGSGNKASSTGYTDSRSIDSPTTASQSVSSTSAASSDYRSSRWKDKDHLLDYDDADSMASGGNVLIRELKSKYREILSLESQLQDEHDEMENEEEPKGSEGYANSQNSDWACREKDDGYWVKLAHSHRQ